MNPSDDEHALTDDYRRASSAEAGRPDPALRKTILAEAAAAARRRAPAANDARYLWRGVAGVAVLGFAVLMWKQVDHRVPGDAPVAVAPPLASYDPALAPQPTVVASDAKPSEAVEASKAGELSRAESRPAAPSVAQSVAAPAAVADSAAAAELVAPAPVSQRAAEAESSDKSSVSGQTANAMRMPPAPAPPASAATDGLRNESARALGKMSAAQDAEVDADALLRLHFPQQYQSEVPRSVWLVQDSAGAVLRSGELAAGRSFGELRPEIERALGGRLLRPWRIRSLQNARGQVIEFAIAQTP